MTTDSPAAVPWRHQSQSFLASARPGTPWSGTATWKDGDPESARCRVCRVEPVDSELSVRPEGRLNAIREQASGCQRPAPLKWRRLVETQGVRCVAQQGDLEL